MTTGSVTIGADGTVTKSGVAGDLYDGIAAAHAAVVPTIVPAVGPAGAPLKGAWALLANGVAPAIGGGSPSGAMIMWGSAVMPTGWLLCDGTAVSRTTYAGIFAAISTTYGVGDGSTTFNLPDFRGRSPMGSGTGTASDATAHALASTGGTETHVLTEAQLASHTHTQVAHAHGPPGGATQFITTSAGVGILVVNAGVGFQENSATGTSTAVNNSTGSGTAHNNLAPFVAVNVIIKT